MKPGDKVIYYRSYRGYPTEKLDAVIVNITPKRVRILIAGAERPIAVPPENLKVIG